MVFVPLATLLHAGVRALLYAYDAAEESKGKDRTIRLLAESHPDSKAILAGGNYALPTVFISYDFQDAGKRLTGITGVGH